MYESISGSDCLLKAVHDGFHSMILLSIVPVRIRDKIITPLETPFPIRLSRTIIYASSETKSFVRCGSKPPLPN